MSMQPQQSNIKLNPFSVMSNWLYAEIPEGSTKRPNMRFGVFGNVPRITVNTNIKDDLNKGKIEWNTDLPTFMLMVSYIDRLAKNEPNLPPRREFIYQNDYVAGKNLGKVVPLTRLVVGREKESERIYIAAISTQTQRPRIKFYFGPSKYHDILNEEGQRVSAREMSELYAIGFADAARLLTTMIIVNDFDPNAKNVANPANMNGGQGPAQSGGYRPQQQRQNNGGGGHGFQTPSSKAVDFDDDIPEF